MWDTLVELVRATLFAGSQVLWGSLGTSIVVISTLVRLAVMPLALRAAREARVQQARLAALRPRLERLRKRYKSDPRRLVVETQALYRENDVRLVTGTSLASMAIQVPLLGALFAAVREGLGTRVRFLWIADLSRVDGLLVLLATGLAAGATMLTPTTPDAPVTPRTLTFIVAAGTLAFLWSASSAVALSVGVGSAVSALQNWLLRRQVNPERPTA